MSKNVNLNKVNLNKKVVLDPRVSQFVDLNTDFGQTRDQAFYEKTEYALLNGVSSVSIPCAVHDGNPRQILETIRLAKQYNCVIGAHIGYPDPARYGYEPMAISAEDLTAWLYVQLGTLHAMLQTEAMEMAYVRPHGALYTAFINNPEVALTVGRALVRFSAWMVLVAPASPILEQLEAEISLRTAPEIYLGKRYNEDGQLIPHRLQEFLSPQGVLDQAKQLIRQSTLMTEDGKKVPVSYKTLHVSPLLPNAVEVADRVGQLLIQPVSLPLAEIGASGWL